MVSSRVVNKILFIVGPTAVGKSEAALQIAEKMDGEIVNADSRQFYRELDVGTARPSRAELERIPHHLVDCASITQPWQVAIFCAEADLAIAEIRRRNKVPIVVGGTGLYIHSLIYGLDKIPPVDEKIRAEIQGRWQQNGIETLYDELTHLDPVAAKRLKPFDSARILRALEVVLQTGQPIHSFWEEMSKPRFDFVMVGLTLEREHLYRQIDERVVKMADEGLKDEVRALWEKHPDNIVLKKTIGYQEWIRHGFANDSATIAEIQKNSRHFAKRQITWFRHERSVLWFDMKENKVTQICDQVF